MHIQPRVLAALSIHRSAGLRFTTAEMSYLAITKLQLVKRGKVHRLTSSLITAGLNQAALGIAQCAQANVYMVGSHIRHMLMRQTSCNALPLFTTVLHTQHCC